MNQRFACIACLTALTLLAGCGGAPAPASEKTWNPRLQAFDFSGAIAPGASRLQLVVTPQAALGTIPEDANGNALSVTPGTVQIYGAVVSYASGGSGYPAACNALAPQVMYSNVEVFSGFSEQLRNVYARLTAKSGGQTFCSKDPIKWDPGGASSFASALNPNIGLYLYEPLNPVTSGNTAIKRSKQWALNLPDNGAFWFSGKLLAEVIPQPPTVNPLGLSGGPTDGATVHMAGFLGQVTFSWTADPLADGTNPEGFTVARPKASGAQLTFKICNASTAAFDPASCVTNALLPAQSLTSGVTATTLMLAGYWYQWTIAAGMILPGNGSTVTYGTLTRTQSFKLVSP